MDIRKKIINFIIRSKEKILISLIPIIFFVVGVMTLSDYGVNWDEPFHFMRGQAYLHYYLSRGERDYKSLPSYPKINASCENISIEQCLFSPGGPSDREKYSGNNLIYEETIKKLYPDSSKIWRSYYQHDTYTFDEIIKIENGHPAVGDILAASFNYIFYQRLHILGDIESYHFFEIFFSTLLVLTIAIVVYLELGVFASIVASASLALYPLFLAESHFNIKDPPETAFFGITILLFYLGITKNKWKYLICSGIFAALALGTKFNAFFIAPVVGVWFIYYLLTAKWTKRKNKYLIISLLVYPVIVAGLFYTLWPYLWSDPINNFMNIFSFYTQIGIGTPAEMSKYIYSGWNTYPIVWITYTTPIPILILAIIGFFVSIYQSLFRKNNFAFLVILWFTIPILRASYPNASIYGGVRQLMEFLPAMAILAGIGTYYLLQVKKYYKLITFVIFLSILFVTYEMVKIHPNQNVYFNQLIGGLSGARDKKIPYWGNSYGNAYQQGLDWINKNAEGDARIGLPISTMGNLPWIKFRSDLEFSNSTWSGPKRGGEYEIELVFDWAPTAWYSFAYYDVYLNPVFEAKVDDVAILKVWKNDAKYTREGYDKELIYIPKSVKKEKTSLLVDMGKEISLSRITINHSKYGCVVQKGGYVSLSTNGKDWIREVEAIDYPQVPPAAVGITDTNFVYLFAAKKTRYLILETAMDNSCLLKKYNLEVRGLSI